MRRLTPICVVVAACGSSSSPPPAPVGNARVSAVELRWRASEPGTMGVGVQVTPSPTASAQGSFVAVHAACQVGAVRHADDVIASPPDAVRVTKAGRLGAALYTQRPLPGQPGDCDLTFYERDDLGLPVRELLRLCVHAGGTQTAGACATNAVDGAVELSVEDARATVEAGHVRLSYRLLAHRDIAVDAARATTATLQCPGVTAVVDRIDRVADGLRAGESKTEGAELLAGATAALDGTCTLIVTAGGDEIARQCWRDHAFHAGACP